VLVYPCRGGGTGGRYMLEGVSSVLICPPSERDAGTDYVQRTAGSRKLDNSDAATSAVSAGLVCGWSELVNCKSIWG